MAKKRVTMTVEVEFDDTVTDAESLSNALDILMDNARSTPGILDDYGDVWVGGFFPPKEASKPKRAAVQKDGDCPSCKHAWRLHVATPEDGMTHCAHHENLLFCFCTKIPSDFQGGG